MMKLTIKLSGGNLPTLTPDQASTIKRDAALGAAIEVRGNFVKLAQRSGSRHFWHDAAALTRLAPEEEDGQAVIVVRKKGVRLHYKGGTVRPTGRPSEFTGKPTKALLIPFDDSPLRKRGVALRELGYTPEQVHVIKSRNGCPLLVAQQQLKTRSNLIWLGKLVKATTHPPRPEVLPTPQEIRKAAIRGARQSIKTILSR